MATELLAPGTAAASSSDFTVSAGGSRFVFLTDADGAELPSGAVFLVEVKDGSNYFPFRTIRSTDAESCCLVNAPSSGDLTCRVRRLASEAGASVGAKYI